MLNKIADRFARLSAIRDCDETLWELAHLAVQLTGVDSACAWVASRQPKATTWCAVQADAAGVVTLGQPRQLAQLPSTSWPAGCDWLALDDRASEVAVPLSVSSQVVAVLIVRCARPLADEQMQALQALGRFFNHHRSLVEENQNDSLTGLRNRKTFDETFSRLSLTLTPPPPDGVERRVHPPQHCWLGVLDIDHFKRINDQHGHLIGDEVLLMLAQLIRQTVRESDLAYRFGGEEFVLLVKTPGAPAALSAFTRLRQAVQRHAFPQVGHIAVSIGITKVLADDMPSDAFGRADRALYWVKQNGRNQVADHETLVHSGTLQEDTAATSVEYF